MRLASQARACRIGPWKRPVSEPIVDIRSLRKVYPGKPPVTAVDGIDLQVAPGELYGLLGPNGAGKTTTISIATTRAVPTAGTVHIAGVDVVARPAMARRAIGGGAPYKTLDCPRPAAG